MTKVQYALCSRHECCLDNRQLFFQFKTDLYCNANIYSSESASHIHHKYQINISQPQLSQSFKHNGFEYEHNHSGGIHKSDIYRTLCSRAIEPRYIDPRNRHRSRFDLCSHDLFRNAHLPLALPQTSQGVVRKGKKNKEHKRARQNLWGADLYIITWASSAGTNTATTSLY